MLPLASRRTITGLLEILPASRYLNSITFLPYPTQSELATTWRYSICNSNAKSNSFSTCRPRNFTNSTWLRKNKKGRSMDEEEASREQYGSNKKSKTVMESVATPVTDTIGLDSLKSKIQQIQERLKKGLGRLPPGGRFNPALLETLRIDLSKLKSAKEASDEEAEIKKASKGRVKGARMKSSTPTAALTEMAQIIPRGAKTALIMLNEEAFAKPVMSALLSSSFSLSPSQSASNPLELIVPIPPPSTQLRSHNLDQVDKLKDKAEFALRDGRADMQKELRALQLGNRIRPDDHHDISKKMEKAVEEAKTEIKRMCDASRKALQS